MKSLLCFIILLAISPSGVARSFKLWSDQELFEAADLVVIARPLTSVDAPEKKGVPGKPPFPVTAVSTEFQVQEVKKGQRGIRRFILHHYRMDSAGVVANGPNLISFNLSENPPYLLFLKKEADGRYAPVSGQTDLAMDSVRKVSDPVR